MKMSETGTDTGARPWHGAASAFEALYQWLVGSGVIAHYVPPAVEAEVTGAVTAAEEVAPVVAAVAESADPAAATQIGQAESVVADVAAVVEENPPAEHQG
jgi:hypothetical protein